MRRFEKWQFAVQNAAYGKTPRLSALDLATRVHIAFINIHPFADGNGRVVRLIVNVLLQMYGESPALIRVDDMEAYFHALRAGQSGNLRLLGSFLSHSITCGLQEKIAFVQDVRAGVRAI